MAVPPMSCEVLIPNAKSGCVEELTAAMKDQLRTVIILGLVASSVQALGLVFAILAYKEAPTQQERDHLLSEEARRLNETWTTGSTLPSEKQPSSAHNFSE